MGKRGPRPLPREVKEQRGTLEQSREPKNPITGLAPLGPAPRGMLAAERKIWRWVRKHARHLRDVDMLLIQRLCEMEVEYAQACEDAITQGRYQTSLTTGYMRLSAAETLKLKLLTELRRLYAEIGTPSSRSRLEMPGPPADDEDEEFLFGKPKLEAVQ